MRSKIDPHTVKVNEDIHLAGDFIMGTALMEIVIIHGVKLQSRHDWILEYFSVVKGLAGR